MLLDSNPEHAKLTDSPADLRAMMPGAAVLDVLDKAARKGRLPGLDVDREARTFTMTDFGKPFESVLTGTVTDDAGAGSSTVRFGIRMKRMLPIVFAVILIATVWPGLPLTDSMLKMYFSSYHIETWWWYLPLTVPFVPLAWRKAMRGSRETGKTEAAELVEKIAKELKP